MLHGPLMAEAESKPHTPSLQSGTAIPS